MENGMTDFVCDKSNNSPTWGLTDIFVWKILPKRFGGGIPYIQNFKDAWVRHNKRQIISSAFDHQFPPELLAGVAWIEVGGDPNFIDRVAYEVRTFDWCGPDWVDKYLTITKHPSKTSFGSVSIQLSTAARTLGLDASTLTTSELRELSSCLEKDVYNIKIVAMHLRELIDHDGLQKNPPQLDFDAVRIVGARYNRGIEPALEKIKENTSYGDFIVANWTRFSNLLK